MLIVFLWIGVCFSRVLIPYVQQPTAFVLSNTMSNTPLTFQIDFNQPIEEGAGDQRLSLLIDQSSLWSSSPRGFDVRVKGPTVSIAPFNVVCKDGQTVTLRVPKGSFFASNNASNVSPMISWSVPCVAQKPFVASQIPSSVRNQALFQAMWPLVRVDNIRKTIVKLASYYNRFYDSDDGAHAMAWMVEQYRSLPNPHNMEVSYIHYAVPWKMEPFEVRIVGKNQDNPVLLGGHLDSINWQNITQNVRTGRAPGADDNASAQGTMLEFVRVLLGAGVVPENSIHIIVFSAEEEGLYGSKAVANAYYQEGVEIKGMLCLDQMGYVNPRHDPVIGIFTDNTDPELTQLVVKIAKAYAPIPGQLSNEGGRSDSDFHSFSDLGFRAAYIAEGLGAPWFDLVYGGDKHTAYNTIEYINFDQLMAVASVAFGFVVEMSF